jgi:hypothetical protein
MPANQHLVRSLTSSGHRHPVSQEVSMKAVWSGLVLIIVLLALLGAEAEAGRMVRDFSGDAMQRYDSNMLSSPIMHFPGLFGLSLWPYIAYPLILSKTIVNVQIQLPEFNQSPTPTPTPLRRAKFWTARCGVFVELEVSSTMNLMDEESKLCAP